MSSLAFSILRPPNALFAAVGVGLFVAVLWTTDGAAQGAAVSGEPREAQSCPRGVTSILDAPIPWQHRPHHLLLRRAETTSAEPFLHPLRADVRARSAAQGVLRTARVDVVGEDPTYQHRIESALSVAQAAVTISSTTVRRYARPDTGMNERRGGLDRPVGGQVSATFGVRAGSSPGSTHRHTGWSFEVEPGTAAHSVGAGVAVFAGIIEGMGAVVVIDHGDGIHTVYGQLTRVRVEPWAPIEEGQIIGDAGTTSVFGTPELYFEIRESGVPVDPAEWLSPL